MLTYTYMTPVGPVNLTVDPYGKEKPVLEYSERIYLAFTRNKEIGCGALEATFDLLFGLVRSQAAAGINVSTPRYRNWVYNTVQEQTENMTWGKMKL